MTMLPSIDRDWLSTHPLPQPQEGADKNSRGRVMLVGGAEFVPGALRLTGEAALRAGAGKLQMATVKTAAMALAVLVPEAAMIALPADEDGEIAAHATEMILDRVMRCDALILGPGMSFTERTTGLVSTILRGIEPGGPTVLLDAAALTCARDLSGIIRRLDGRVIMTPHHGEMALLADVAERMVKDDPVGTATRIANRFNAVVLLKSKESILAAPGGERLHHGGGCIGLATGGSGDVLAGIIGGLAARGADPLVAAAWGAWAHGQAGTRLSQTHGLLGFLARELVPLIPAILNGVPNRFDTGTSAPAAD